MATPALLSGFWCACSSDEILMIPVFSLFSHTAGGKDAEGSSCAPRETRPNQCLGFI